MSFLLKVFFGAESGTLAWQAFPHELYGFSSLTVLDLSKNRCATTRFFLLEFSCSAS